MSACPSVGPSPRTNLGVALRVLGGREIGTARLEEAIVAYREALKESTHERVPLNWAASQKIWAMRWPVADREGGTTKLEEAVIA